MGPLWAPLLPRRPAGLGRLGREVRRFQSPSERGGARAWGATWSPCPRPACPPCSVTGQGGQSLEAECTQATLWQLTVALGRCVPTSHSEPVLAEAEGCVRGLATSARACSGVYTGPVEGAKDLSDRAKITVGGFGLWNSREPGEGAAQGAQQGLDRGQQHRGGGRLWAGPFPGDQAGPPASSAPTWGRTNALCEHQFLLGELELPPQGTLLLWGHRGARVLPAHGLGDPGAGGRCPIRHVPGGHMAIMSQPREEGVSRDRCLLEQPVTAGFALVKVWKAHRTGTSFSEEAPGISMGPRTKPQNPQRWAWKKLWTWGCLPPKTSTFLTFVWTV